MTGATLTSLSTAPSPAATLDLHSLQALRAEQVGCLLRPHKLEAARRVRAERRISDAGLRVLEDQAVVDSLREQADHGMHVYTDGQFRRRALPTGWPSPEHTGHRRRIAAGEVAFLRAHAPGPFKIAVPSPSSLALARVDHGALDVDRLRALLARCGAALHDELAALADEGAHYIQLDCRSYGVFAEPEVQEALRAAGITPAAMLDEAIEADNDALAALPRSQVAVAAHVCRGTVAASWLTGGAGAPLAEQLLPALDYDRLLIECDPNSSGGLDVLATVPEDRTVALALVDAKVCELPPYGQLLARVQEATTYVPLERLAVSSGCKSTVHQARSAFCHDDQRSTMALIGRLAADLWPQ